MRAHSVCLVESLHAFARMPPLPLFGVKLEQESVASHARSYTTMPDSGDALQSDNNPTKHERIRCAGVLTNGSVSSLWEIGLYKWIKC